MKAYEIIIIGSGMGGLIVGALLSKNGYNVCVLEKNRQIGGCLQTYVRDKVIFDSGVHYIGGLEPGQNLYQIFKYLGIINKLKLQRMDINAFDKIIFDGDNLEYNLAQGHENFIKQLLIHFPNEEEALRSYCNKITEVCSKFPLYKLQSGSFFDEKSSILGIDTKGFIESITNNVRLQEVLAGNNSLYAGSPDKTPFYIHALVLNSFLESSWKCVDGGSQIARLLSKSITENGGEIRRNAKVKRITEEQGRIIHVELNDGTQIQGMHFISNIHPVKTMELVDSGIIKNAYRNRLKSLENTISSFTLNIVLKKDSFRYFKNNYYCHDHGSVWESAEYTEKNWPLGYAIFLQPSSKVTNFAIGMTILSYMRYDEVRQWQDTNNTVSNVEDRGPEYETFKKHKAEILISKVEKKFPGLRNCIQSYYTATPLSYRDYIGNDDGSLYGIVKDYKNPLKTFISPKTKIPNLYLTGQNLNLHGILGVAISGIITASIFLDSEKLIEKIRNA